MGIADITWSTGSTLILLVLVGMYFYALLRQYGGDVLSAYRTLRKRDRDVEVTEQKKTLKTGDRGIEDENGIVWWM